MKATQVFSNVIDPEESESGGFRSITGRQGGLGARNPPSHCLTLTKMTVYSNFGSKPPNFWFLTQSLDARGELEGFLPTCNDTK